MLPLEFLYLLASFWTLKARHDVYLRAKHSLVSAVGFIVSNADGFCLNPGNTCEFRSRSVDLDFRATNFGVFGNHESRIHPKDGITAKNVGSNGSNSFATRVLGQGI